MIPASTVVAPNSGLSLIRRENRLQLFRIMCQRDSTAEVSAGSLRRAAPRGDDSTHLIAPMAA
jgi:hypothetical protein